MTAVCCLCDTEITDENDTKEHLIPNALGGRRKIKGFICVDCNSKSGETWDGELAQQLHPLAMLFEIQRERGDVAPLNVTTTAGEKLTLRADEPLTIAKPEFNRKNLPTGGTEYKISARTMGEARKILLGLKKKHPELDVEKLLSEAEMVETLPEGVFHFQIEIGGEVAGRSIVKSCLAMAVSLGIDSATCGHATKYLRDAQGVPCFGYYSETDLVSGRVKGVPMHCLAVRADPESGLVLAYAEYYGAYRIVACLGEHYDDRLKEGVYCIDPRTGKELNVSVSLDFSREEINDIYDYKKQSLENTREALSAVIGPAVERNQKLALDRALERAAQKAFAGCGAKEGELLTPEHMRIISQIFTEEIAPYLIQRMRPVDSED